MTCGGRLAGVDMSDDHDVDMRLLLSHLARLNQNKQESAHLSVSVSVSLQTLADATRKPSPIFG
jgi:hypothetical protein